MSNKTDYNKIYKDQTRVVTYVKPDVKATLAQHALDNNISLSTLCEPKLEELANELKQR